MLYIYLLVLFYFFVIDLERLIVRDTPSYKVIVGLLTEIFINGEGQPGINYYLNFCQLCITRSVDRSFTVSTKNLFNKFFIKETKIATFLAQMVTLFPTS